MILIVDDDRDIRESLCDLLADEGYATAEAADGGEALTYLREHDAQLILLDWNMQPVDAPAFMIGLATIERAKATPVVLLTADSRITSKGLLPGYMAMLKKPVNLEQLFELVRRYCTQVVR